MSDNKIVKIDNVEYNINDFNEAQKAVFEHVVDLERKMKVANFNLVQLQFSLNAFIAQLKSELDKTKDSQ